MIPLRTLRKSLSVLLVVVLVPLILAQITAHTARALVTDAARAKSIIRQSGLYGEMEKALAGEMVARLQDADAPIALTRSEVDALLGRVLPASRLEAYGDTLVDGLYGWALTGSGRPSIVLDLAPVRAALPGAVRDAVIARVEALPVCTAAQLPALARIMANGSVPPCKSPAASVNQAIIDRVLPAAQIAGFLPARLDVAAEVEQRNPSFWQEANLKTADLRRLMSLVTMGWAVLAVVLLLLAALNLDRWYTPLGWLSAPLLLAGGLLIAGALAAATLVMPQVQEAALDAGQVGPVVVKVAEAALRAVAGTVRRLGQMMAMSGLVALGASVAGGVLSGSGSEPKSPAV